MYISDPLQYTITSFNILKNGIGNLKYNKGVYRFPSSCAETARHSFAGYISASDSNFRALSYLTFCHALSVVVLVYISHKSKHGCSPFRHLTSFSVISN